MRLFTSDLRLPILHCMRAAKMMDTMAWSISIALRSPGIPRERCLEQDHAKPLSPWDFQLDEQPFSSMAGWISELRQIVGATASSEGSHAGMSRKRERDSATARRVHGRFGRRGLRFIECRLPIDIASTPLNAS